MYFAFDLMLKFSAAISRTTRYCRKKRQQEAADLDQPPPAVWVYTGHTHVSHVGSQHTVSLYI